MNDKSTRRNFLKTAALAPLAATSAAPFTGMAAAAEPVLKAEGSPLKVSLNAYSFAQALTAPAAGAQAQMTLFDVLDFCAQYNFDGLDPTGYYFPGYPQVPADSYIYDLKRRAFKLGIGLSGTGVRNNFAQADKDKRAADVQMVKDWIEVAAKLGAPVIRVFAGAAPADRGWDEVAAWVAADLKACVEHGKRHGVVVGVQNHNDFLKTAEQVIKLVKLVDSEWFGVIVDTGNFQNGDPYEEIARVVPYAVNFQLKEKPGGPAGSTRTDVKKLIRIIRAGGYRGYLPIETLVAPGQPYNPRVAIPAFLKEVREAIAETA